MASVVVDSSAWIEYLRDTAHPAGQAVRHLLIHRRALLCPVVEMELLRGVRPNEKAALAAVIGVVPTLAMERQDFQFGGELMNRLLAKGVTVPPLDGLLAAVCLRRGAEILTMDRHFGLIPGLVRHPLP